MRDMRVYVIRHWETRANVHGFLQWQIDEPLLETGRMLAAEVGRALAGTTFDAAFSSPLSRAKETARLVLDNSGNVGLPIQEDPRLIEVSMGECEGKRFRPGEREIDEELVRLFFEDPFSFSGFPAGESARDVCERTQAFLEELLGGRLLEGHAKTVLVSTHGFALRAMLNRLYDDPSDFWQGGVPLNCCVSVIKARDGKVVLDGIDEVFYDKSRAVDRYASY